MPALSEPQKVFVVQQLAMFRTPTEVAEAVKERFGIELSRQQVHYYDPERSGGRELPEKWRTLWKDTREAYRGRVAEIGIANQVWRLEQLERLFRDAMRQGRSGNIPLATDILKQAAEETGGKYTNHHVMEHAGKVEVGGVLLAPVPAGDMGDWMREAMDGQAELERVAAAETERYLGSDGPPGES